MRVLISSYISRLKTSLDELEFSEIENFISILNNARKNGNNIYIMGNGGSALTASHFCCDFNKGASYGVEDKKRFKFICLNDNIATMMAYSNDVSYDDVFVEQLKNFLQPDDVVIGISGSGNSKNVLKAIEYANENKAVTVGLTGYSGGRLREISSCSVNTNVNDMQISEDIHMMLCHMLMQIVCKSDVCCK